MSLNDKVQTFQIAKHLLWFKFLNFYLAK